MGLRDVLTGMMHGPRGRRPPSSSGGGMSPILWALLGLLAYKALRGGGGQAQRPDYPPPRGDFDVGRSGGGLGNILGGLFGGGRPGSSYGPSSGSGGFLGGAATGAMLSAGLAKLIESFRQQGYGDTAQSWVSTGPNQEIAPSDLENALGEDTIEALSRQTGMPREDLVAELSRRLPGFVDQLTPEGRLPTEEEASRMG